MWSRIFAAVLALAVNLPAGASAVSAAPARPCRVVNGGKLPADSGGADAICSAVETAISARAPHVRYSAEIRVLSKSGLAATIVADGQKLPEQKFSVSDRNLNPLSIKHFADALAEQVAKFAKG